MHRVAVHEGAQVARAPQDLGVRLPVTTDGIHSGGIFITSTFGRMETVAIQATGKSVIAVARASST